MRPGSLKPSVNIAERKESHTFSIHLPTVASHLALWSFREDGDHNGFLNSFATQICCRLLGDFNLTNRRYFECKRCFWPGSHSKNSLLGVFVQKSDLSFMVGSSAQEYICPREQKRHQRNCTC